MNRESNLTPAPSASHATPPAASHHRGASGGFAAVAFITAFTVALGGCTKPLAGDASLPSAPASVDRFASGAAGQSPQADDGRQDAYLPARFPLPAGEASGNVATFERD